MAQVLRLPLLVCSPMSCELCLGNKLYNVKHK
jgi:hypothetical protein